jgi:hypothetical protein
MPLIATTEGASKYPILAEDVYQAVCFSIYDLGTQHSEKFQNNYRKCIIVWEIPSELIEVERNGLKCDLPRAVSKEYTLSLNEKANLRKDLENWRGRKFTEDELKGFDLEKLIGVNCMVQIIHTTKGDKTYANVSTVLPLYKGIAALKPINPTTLYDTYQGEPPADTPKWIVEKIHDSLEWVAAHTQGQEDRDRTCPADDEQVPF